MWRALLLTLCCSVGTLAGCASKDVGSVPLAKSVQAALADPSGLPRAVTKTAGGTAEIAAADAGVAAVDVASADITGSDTAGADTAGADTAGADTAGADTTGSDATGSDATGSDTTSAETAVVVGRTRDAGAATARAVAASSPDSASAHLGTPTKQGTGSHGKSQAKTPKPRRRSPSSTRRTKAARARGKPRTPPSPPADSAVPLPPGKDATDLYYEGKRALTAQNYAGAIAALRASQQLRPSSRTLTLLGQAYLDGNRLKDAERSLKRAGNRAGALLLLATLYQQQGKSAKARRVLKALLTYHPDHARADWARRMLKAL